MNLNDLRYVVAVADHRSFRRAAEDCFVSQPTLSAQIRKLERELGVQLFERTSQGVLLTAAGEQVLAHARTIVDEAEAIRATALRATDPESGPVRLGIFPTLGPYLLPHVVPALHRRFPRVELLLTEEKTEVVLAGLRAGTLDVGVLAAPVEVAHLHEEILFEEDFVLALPADHPLGARDEVTLDAIADERLLLLEDGHCLREQALSVCSLAGAHEREDFRATSLETLRQMVAAGVGITLLPELSVEPPVAPNDAIALVHFAAPAPRRTIAMYWRTTHPAGELLARIADEIRAVPLPSHSATERGGA
jgi:LysR family hydrogen peroxide-inducible transcriptional activator